MRIRWPNVSSPSSAPRPPVPCRPSSRSSPSKRSIGKRPSRPRSPTPRAGCIWFTAVRPPGETYINLYAHDVTKRAQVEKALRESEAKYRSAFRIHGRGIRPVRTHRGRRGAAGRLARPRGQRAPTPATRESPGTRSSARSWASSFPPSTRNICRSLPALWPLKRRSISRRTPRRSTGTCISSHFPWAGAASPASSRTSPRAGRPNRP